jgi:hypothetical protein
MQMGGLNAGYCKIKVFPNKGKPNSEKILTNKRASLGKEKRGEGREDGEWFDTIERVIVCYYDNGSNVKGI